MLIKHTFYFKKHFKKRYFLSFKIVVSHCLASYLDTKSLSVRMQCTVAYVYKNMEYMYVK